MFATVLEDIRDRKRPGQRLLIGLDGLSASGKTTLVEQIRNAGVCPCAVIHIDDHITERSKRYDTGFPEWHEHYFLQWDVDKLRQSLFDPLAGGATALELDFYDPETDTTSIRTVAVPADGIVLIEGVFLQRPEWRRFFDYLIYLDCPRSVRFERDTARSQQDPHYQARIAKFQRRYWRAEDHYLQTVQPLLHADRVCSS